jgi:hypothetical protein
MIQPLNVPIDDKRYKLVREYNYLGISVPKGFVYDGASVPRWLWSITDIRPDGLIRAPALIHDWLYRRGGNVNGRRFSRKEADLLFCRMMKESGIGIMKCKMVYWAVRVFAGSYWQS